MRLYVVSIMSWHCEQLSWGHFRNYCNKIILYKFLHRRNGFIARPDCPLVQIEYGFHKGLKPQTIKVGEKVDANKSEVLINPAGQS